MAKSASRQGSSSVSLYNVSPKTKVQASLSSTYDGAVFASTTIAPGDTVAVPTSSGMAVLSVRVGASQVWSGAVPTSSRGPVVISPDLRTVTYADRIIPQTPILEAFRFLELDRMSTGMSDSVHLGIFVVVAIVLLLACFVCFRLKIVNAKRKK